MRFVAPARRRSSPGRNDGRRLAAAFILPPLLIYVVFMLVPFLTSVYYSLTDWDGAAPQLHFIGLDNYIRLLTDGQLLSAASHNLVWLFVGTIPPIAIGGLLALLIWAGVRLAPVWRAIYFVPFVLAPIVVGVAWSWIYNPLF